jgi:tripartite-type tricarboxylate transporter receptor subunit TctC
MGLQSIRERMAIHDYEIATSSPAEFGAFMKSEIAQWAKVVKQAGVKLD